MDGSDENLDMLCSMGFIRESAKRALRLAKNDLNEAVAILTGDHPTSGFDTLYETETFSSPPQSSTVYGPSLPPSYDTVVEADTSAQSGQVSFLQKSIVVMSFCLFIVNNVAVVIVYHIKEAKFDRSY